MAASTSTVVFLLLILSQTLTLIKSDKSTIESTCKSTNHYDLCVSSLKSDPRSPTADTKGLAAILIGVGITNATTTATYIAGNFSASVNDTGIKKLLKDCSEKYNLAADSLKLANQDLEIEAYDYAYIHVMAANDYPNVCRSFFRRVKGSIYPMEIRRREESFRGLCGVVSAIIDRLTE